MRTKSAVGCAALIIGMAPALSAPLSECAYMYEGVGMPAYQGEDPNNPDYTLLCRDGYLLSHNADSKVPDWVLERLTPSRFKGPGDRDKSEFAPDDELPADGRAELADYKGSGFDRGHQAPAADMKYSQPATDESFFLSNMAPQVGIGFNRHVWAHLEDRVRGWAEHREDVIAFTGPIYGEKTIGANNVAVPTHFYKIMYEPGRRRAIALILPNKKISGNDLRDYVTSIDEVEERTGLDFLTDIPNSVEVRVERNVASLWAR